MSRDHLKSEDITYDHAGNITHHLTEARIRNVLE